MCATRRVGAGLIAIIYHKIYKFSQLFMRLKFNIPKKYWNFLLYRNFQPLNFELYRATYRMCLVLRTRDDGLAMLSHMTCLVTWHTRSEVPAHPYLSILAARGQSPAVRWPSYAEDPVLVSLARVKGSFCEHIPESNGRISRPTGQLPVRWSDCRNMS